MARYDVTATVETVEDSDDLLDGQVSVGDTLHIELTMPYRPLFNNFGQFRTPEHFDFTCYNDRMQFGYKQEFPRIDNDVLGLGKRNPEAFKFKCTTSVVLINYYDHSELSEDEALATPSLFFRWERIRSVFDEDCELPDTLDMTAWDGGTVRLSSSRSTPRSHYTINASFDKMELTELEDSEFKVFAFNDLNNNCQRDDGEPGVPDIEFTVGNLPTIFSTQTDGISTNSSPLSKGFIEILPQDDWQVNCNGNQITYNLIADGPNPTLFIPLTEKQPAEENPNFSAAPLSIGATALRPGETVEYIVFLNNQDEETQDGRLRFEFDERLRYESGNPAPSEVNLPLLVWDVNQIEPEERRRFIVRFKVPNDKSLQGETFCSAAKFDYDEQSQFYFDSYCQRIAGDYDPFRLQRIKQEGSDENETVDAQNKTEYMIRIHNDDSRTARNVHVTIPARTELDLNTFFVGAASHEFVISESESGDKIISFYNIMLKPQGSDVNTEAFIRLGFTLDAGIDDKFISEHTSVRFDYIEEVDPALSAAQTSAGPVQFSESEPVASGVTATPTPWEVLVFPNPANDVVTIKLNNAADAIETTISLTNLFGQTVLTRTMLSDTYTLGLRALPPGSYYLTLRRGAATTMHHLKIVR